MNVTTRWKLAAIILVVLNILGFAGLAFGEANNAIANTANKTTISQLVANAAVISAAQEQQQLIFDNVLAKFFREENFICEELVAHNKVLGGPTPPPGICSVSLPMPKS